MDTKVTGMGLNEIDHTIKLKAGGLSYPTIDDPFPPRVSEHINGGVEVQEQSTCQYWQSECIAAEVKRDIRGRYCKGVIREVDNIARWKLKTRRAKPN